MARLRERRPSGAAGRVRDGGAGNVGGGTVMRKAPPLPANTKRRAENAETRTYGFLTYVMGGGVRIREHQKLSDPVTPVRSASIRGQLRFWWRACNPSGCKTV